MNEYKMYKIFLSCPNRKILQDLMEFGEKIYVNWKLYESAILLKDLARIDNFEDGYYIYNKVVATLTINFSNSSKIIGYVFRKLLFVGDQDVIIIYHMTLIG